ncbi:MAG: translocation/assembly module TamB domain-containing protein, partial [Flavobacterium sp.]
IINSKIGSNDIYCFYKDIGKNKTFLINTKMYGTLNNFWLKNLSFQDGKESSLKGDLKMINSFGNINQPFQLNAYFKSFESSYEHLVGLLPSLLSKNLPLEIKKLNKFTLSGTTLVNAKDLIAKVKLNSSLGFLETDLAIKNVYNTNNATYKGVIKTKQFDIGKLINDPKIGKSTINIQVDGMGFKPESLNTNFNGVITNFNYNNYQYQNIEINGLAKKPLFSGKINSNDPNLKMNFDGTVDFSKSINKYQFKSDITYANLKKLNLINDSVAIFKGKINSNLTGNSIDNIQGEINILEANYQKNKKIFNFKDVFIQSKFDENKERKLLLNASNILEGEMIGKFSFGSIPNMVQNAIGSIYTNYKKHNLSKNSYMKFNFLVNNQLLEIFYPEVQLEKPSRIKGNINTLNNEFKLYCNAEQININKNKLFNLKLELDNKNPVYNAYITLDSIQNKRYTISEFNLLNITEKDTMRMRTEFKGGKKKNDFYNLNFYHTIDAGNQNIIGFNKSEIFIKNYMWYLNEEKNNKNKIIFDKNFKNFYFDDLSLSHENEKAKINGALIGNKNKDINLILKNLNINKLMPFEVGPEIEGNLTGSVNLYETIDLFEPKADLELSNFKLNNNLLGDLKFDVSTNKNLNLLDINLSLDNEITETVTGTGTLDISTKKPKIDFDISVNQFDISFLNKFSESIISKVKGLASGTISVQKELNNPDINGRLYLNNGEFKVDFTEVLYQIADESIIDITQNLFTFRKIELTDQKYKSKGILNGFMKHQGFDNWFFNLDISSDYINIFDKKDDDESPFYGTAFIKGTSSIKGPMNAIVLNINAYSEAGTTIKIPITNSTNSGENSLVSYLTPEEKFKKNINIKSKKEEYYGLEMNFDLYIDKDAEIEVILNKETGHSMKGRGAGNLLIAINTLGKFNMFGDISIYDGIYNFSYESIIKKPFKISPNSTIVWDGDPFKADLNIKAIYEIYANPSVLLENSSLNGRTVPVEVGIDLIGKLDN